jgi:hypothetical protein
VAELTISLTMTDSAGQSVTESVTVEVADTEETR